MRLDDKNTLHYVNTILTLKKWLNAGFIDAEDYEKMEARAAEKFGIKSIDIYRSIDLLYIPFRVIYMCDKKEEKNV